MKSESLLIYLLIAAVVIFRYTRPMKMSVFRLFIAPLVFVAITALSIYGTQRLNPAPAYEIALAVVAGSVLGIPLGVAMTAHRTVRRTEKPHVMYVEPSWITAGIWMGAFVLKAVIRSMLPAGNQAAFVADGLLVFGISAVLASYAVIYRKFKALDTPAPGS